MNKLTMTSLLVFILLFSLSAAISAQGRNNSDRLGVERVLAPLLNGAEASADKRKVSQANLAGNAEQPGFAWRGATVEVRVISVTAGPATGTSRRGAVGEVTYRQSGNARRQAANQQNQDTAMLRAAVAQVVTGLGGRAASSVSGIEAESSDRGGLRANTEVNQASMPPQGSITVASHILEVSVLRVRSESDLSAFFGSIGRWGQTRGLGFIFSRETAYTAVKAELKDRATLETVAVYGVVGHASSADNVGLAVAGGLLGSTRFGFQQSLRDWGVLEMRSLDNALSELLGVCQRLNTSVGRNN